MQKALKIRDKPDKWKCGITDCRLKLHSTGSTYGASGAAGSGTGAAAAGSPTAASNVILGVSSLGRVRHKKRSWEQVE